MWQLLMVNHFEDWTPDDFGSLIEVEQVIKAHGQSLGGIVFHSVAIVLDHVISVGHQSLEVVQDVLLHQLIMSPAKCQDHGHRNSKGQSLYSTSSAVLHELLLETAFEGFRALA